MLNISKHSFYKVTDEYIYNDIQMIQTSDGEFIYENISLYIYGNTVLTFQERKGDVFDSVRERIQNNSGDIRMMGVEYTYFCLLDAIVDHYIYSLENMLSGIEKMEFELMENQSLDSNELHRYRKQIILISMSANTLDKLLLDLLKLEEEGFLKSKEYFESLSQHVRMTINEVNVQKESIDGLYDNYMINNSNNMNHIMTILTIFSAIFIPLSFLAGVFGMNFKNFPGLDNVNGIYYFIIGCLVTAGLMIFYFKKKKWF
jgi:magnesium transporter